MLEIMLVVCENVIDDPHENSIVLNLSDTKHWKVMKRKVK